MGSTRFFERWQRCHLGIERPLHRKYGDGVDDQIYLVPGEPYQPDGSTDAAEPPPRRTRRRAFGLAGLLALAAVAVGVQHARVSHLPAVPVAAPAAAAATPGSLQPWPQGIGVCDSLVDLPQVSYTLPQGEPAGTTVAVAGALPALVNVATGQRSAIPGLRLRADQYASTIVRSGAVSYVLVRNCQRRWMATVVRAQAGQPQRVVSGDRAVYGLLGDDTGAVWAEAFPEATKISPAEAVGTTLVRLDRPAPAVELPPSLTVIGLSGNQAVAVAAGSPRTVTLQRLYRYDLVTRRASQLGLAYSVTVSRGKVFWTSTPCSAVGACALRSYDLRTGRVGLRDFHLPLGSGVTGGVLSPDGHKLAFVLEKEIPDRYYRSSSPDNPADLVVLDLTTGILDPVPDLELPPGMLLSSGGGSNFIGFSTDSNWLIVALPNDGWTDLYAWQHGMSLAQIAPRAFEWAGLTEKQVSPQ